MRDLLLRKRERRVERGGEGEDGRGEEARGEEKLGEVFCQRQGEVNIVVHDARCQIFHFKCTKFNFGRGSVPDPAA